MEQGKLKEDAKCPSSFDLIASKRVIVSQMEIEEQYNTMRLNTFGSGLVLKPPVITLDLYKEGLVFLVTLFPHGTGSLKFESSNEKA